MFCLVYEFVVKEDMEDIFLEGWHDLTLAMTRMQGSLGARLHKTPDGRWISYAQWPDREAWQAGEEVIFQFLAASNWKNCLDGHVKLLMQMEMVDDLLQPVPSAR